MPSGFTIALPKDDAPEPAGAATDAAVAPELGVALEVVILVFDLPADGVTAGAARGAAAAEATAATEAFAGSAAGAAVGAGAATTAVGMTGAGAGEGAGGNSATTGLAISFGNSLETSLTTSLGISLGTSLGMTTSTGLTSTTFSGGFCTTNGFSTGFSTGLGGSGGLGGTGRGSTGVVMVFLTVTGFSTGLISSGGFGTVIIFFGGGLGKGCVMGKFSITTVSRTTRCTGAVCNSNQNKAICTSDTANNAGGDSREPGNCGAEVVKIISVMIKAFIRAFAAKPTAHPATARKLKEVSPAPSLPRHPLSSPPWWARQFAPQQTRQ